MPQIGDSKKSLKPVDFKPRECYNPRGVAKMRFNSKKEAKQAIKQMNYTTHKGLPMQRNAQVYRCSICSKFHIGHKS